MRTYISPVLSDIYNFFNGTYGRLTQRKPVQEVFEDEISPIQRDIRTSPIIIGTIKAEPEDGITDSSDEVRAVEYVTQEPLWQKDIILDLEWFGQENNRPRQEAETELVVWWRDFRKKTRTEPLTILVTIFDEELNASKLENYPDLEVDDAFICGISQEVMTNPVYDPAFPEQKYDLLVIESWLHEHEQNPCTGTPLLMENLVHDDALKLRIDRFMSDTFQEAVRSNQY